MKYLLRLFVVTTILTTCITGVAAQTSYQTPPPEVAALVDAPSSPGFMLSPDRSVAILLHSPGVRTIEDLAQPEYRLAGIRINPRTNGPSRSGYNNRLSILEMDDLTERDITGLPNNPRIQNVSFSPNGARLAFTVTMDQHIELWSAEVATGQAKRLGAFAVNNTWSGAPFDWFPNSTKLLVRTITPDRKVEPIRSLAPSGPTIQDATGDAAPARTYQDLLSDAHDVALFDYYFTSQLMVVDISGSTSNFGSEAIYSSIAVSPDGQYVLTSKIELPYSYTVPASRFPQTTQVMDVQGNIVTTVAKIPLLDNVPIAFNSTWEGRRSISWRADAPSTLYFVEAQDGGNPMNDVEIRDIVYLLEAPFNGNPTELAQLATRYAGVAWGNDELAIVSESWRETRNSKAWRVQPGNPSSDKTLLFDRNYEDRYADPGSPVYQSLGNGFSAMHLINNGTEILMSGQGASPEGWRPFLRAFSPEDGSFRELWRSEAPYYASVSAIVDEEANIAIIRRESNETPPNYVEVNLANNRSRTITDFPHPTPELVGVQSEFLNYERADGLPLTGQLLLPPGYNAERDGPLPLMIWAYPREFASADAAGQVSDSPHRFNAISYWGPHFLVTQGYAVLNNASMPIVAPGPGQEPNDIFLEQLVGNAKAAIDYLAERGIADPERVAVGGH